MVKRKSIAVISDTSPLLFFIDTEGLFILKKLFGKIIISNEVYKEIKNRLQKETLNKEIKKGWIKKEKAPKLNILHSLDLGEASAISLAFQYDESLLIADDKQARNFAKGIGLNVIGIIGIIVLAKEKKIISEVKRYLSDLSKRIWIDKNLVKQVLKKCGE